MSSFYAELHLDGQRYPVVHCSHKVFQGVAPRGRATSKVRHGRVLLRLDVPDAEQLLYWAAAPAYPPDGYTWHHRVDFKPTSPPNPPYGTCTTELVEEKARQAPFVPYGSCGQCNKHVGQTLYK